MKQAGANDSFFLRGLTGRMGKDQVTVWRRKWSFAADLHETCKLSGLRLWFILYACVPSEGLYPCYTGE